MTETHEILGAIEDLDVGGRFTTSSLRSKFNPTNVYRVIKTTNCVQPVTDNQIPGTSTVYEIIDLPSPGKLNICHNCKRLGDGGCMIFNKVIQNT